MPGYSKEQQTQGYVPGPKKKQPINKAVKIKGLAEALDSDKPISANTYNQLFGKQNRQKKKYYNKSKVYTTSLYGTRTFDSIKEAQYCEELDWRLKKGQVKRYWLQWKIDIKINGQHWRNYFIDYRVELPNGSFQYVEVKGYATETWKQKWDALLILRDMLLEPGCELIVIK